MKLTLVDINPAVCQALRTRFGAEPDVTVVQGGFERLPAFDCFLTAGNSFGLMDGGVDRAVVRYFGPEIEAAVQAHILEHYLGEQPVGTCVLVDTGRTDRRFVAHAPTMRVPMNISRTDNVYLAFWAALLAVRHHNRVAGIPSIEHLAAPGLGTGVGGMSPDEGALQMHLAWRHFHEAPARISPGLAKVRHARVHYGGNRGFEFPRVTTDE